jgi:L,D-peptidoglycan transpeptidase YkuD (ErfK/YbiS/YcfS/YnhG family)
MRKIILLLFTLINFGHTQSLPKDTKQLLVVSVDNVTQNYAELLSFEKDGSNHWKKVFKPIPVMLGRNGVGLGLGLHPSQSNIIEKKEGDGKSPLGLFRLTHIFGYALRPVSSKMPYITATKSLHCVDDSNSKLYNQIVTAQEGYRSHEIMKRDDSLYEYGIVVEHNREGLKKRGSCIFIHIMSKEKKPTSGCTSMQKEHLLQLTSWLDSSKNPLLLQRLKSDGTYISDQTANSLPLGSQK